MIWGSTSWRETDREEKKKRLKTKQAFALALTPLGCVVKELAHIMSSSRYERWSLGNVLYLLLAPSLKKRGRANTVFFHQVCKLFNQYWMFLLHINHQIAHTGCVYCILLTFIFPVIRGPQSILGCFSFSKPSLAVEASCCRPCLCISTQKSILNILRYSTGLNLIMIWWSQTCLWAANLLALWLFYSPYVKLQEPKRDLASYLSR